MNLGKIFKDSFAVLKKKPHLVSYQLAILIIPLILFCTGIVIAGLFSPAVEFIGHYQAYDDYIYNQIQINNTSVSNLEYIAEQGEYRDEFGAYLSERMDWPQLNIPLIIVGSFVGIVGSMLASLIISLLFWKNLFPKLNIRKTAVRYILLGLLVIGLFVMALVAFLSIAIGLPLIHWAFIFISIIALFAFIGAVFYFSVRLTFSFYALLDGKKVIEAIDYSLKLTNGRFWMIALYAFIFALVGGIAGQLNQGMYFLLSAFGAEIVAMILYILMTVLFFVLYAIAATYVQLLYFYFYKQAKSKK